MLWKLPENIDLKQASALGAAVMTSALSLYHELKVPFPGEGKVDEGTWVSTLTSVDIEKDLC